MQTQTKTQILTILTPNTNNLYVCEKKSQAVSIMGNYTTIRNT